MWTINIRGQTPLCRSVKYTDICALELYTRLWQFPKDLNIEELHDPTIPLLTVPKAVESRDSNRYVYSTVQSLSTHNSQKAETTPVAMCGRVGKQNVSHTYKGLFVSCKRNEILTRAASWRNLEDIKLSEVSQIPSGNGSHFSTAYLINKPVLKICLKMFVAKAIWGTFM